MADRFEQTNVRHIVYTVSTCESALSLSLGAGCADDKDALNGVGTVRSHRGPVAHA